MSRTEEQDQQVTCKYVFTITPLEIKSNSKLKTNNKKAVLIKLGNKTAKCTQMNTQLVLDIDVLYSKTLQKYCPVKGIIKIYDVSEDGTQIISCVGGFQTDQLLNQGKSHIILQKDIGTSKLKMEINIVNKTPHLLVNKQNPVSKHLSISDPVQQKVSVEKVLSPKGFERQNNPLKLSNSSEPRSIVSQGYFVPQRRTNALLSRPIDLPHKNTSSNINKSLQKINQALNFKRIDDQSSSKANQVLLKSEVETVKHQLAEEKKKNTFLEQRVAKGTQKISNCQLNLVKYQKDSKQYRQAADRLLSTLELRNFLPKTQMKLDLLKLELSCKSKQAQGAFKHYFELIVRKNSEPFVRQDLQIQGLDSQKMLNERQQTKKQLAILKKLTMEKDKKIFSLQKQLQGMEKTITNLKEANKHVNEQNSYLRQKNDQVEMNLYHKESAIEALKKQTEQLEIQLQEIDGKLYNAGLQNQQLKEEVSNCNQTIQRYRQKYGDLKNVKNRAIQMQIKQCIRWLDLQNRDLQMTQMEETTDNREPDLSDSWSSVIRGIEIEKVPIEEMSIIRRQLLKILQKVEHLMSK